MPSEDQTLTRLASQISRGEVVLFTGAGFSLSAKDRKGRGIPSSKDLKKMLWEKCFPSDDYDLSSTLGDLYELALKRKPSELGDLLEEKFSINPESIPDFYKLYYDFPWHRIYTLNIDDIEMAVESKFPIRRSLKIISVTHKRTEDGFKKIQDGLEIVHLNGIIPGPPESLTFSEAQYARRIAGQEAWYSRCAADLTTHPVIFIGTELREAPLWQHMELRRIKEGVSRDLRPMSVLVSPTLSQSRRELLRELKIEWIQESAESFANLYLNKMLSSASQGFIFLSERLRFSGRVTIPLVSELAADRPDLDSQYLIGAEPIWSDLLTGRAFVRTDDEVLFRKAKEILEGKTAKTALLVTGTAGAGKSTALMRLALRFSGESIPVFWIDRDSEATPTLMREKISRLSGPVVLAIDDADLYGRQLAAIIKDLVPLRKEFLFVAAIRSTKIDDVCNAIKRSKEVSIMEHTVPNLTDIDIEGLIATLDNHNRLGILKGKSASDRRKAFQAEAGRQLLISMIQATSGRKFDEKAHQELQELPEPQRFIYALVAVASGFRLYLTRDEILIASGDVNGNSIEALDRLSSRHLVAPQPPDYRYRVRHRVIADIIIDKLTELGQLKDVIAGLAFAAASKVEPNIDRRERPWRLLRSVLNHAFLLRVLKVPDARNIYEQLEKILNFDFHYWLQRGSLEVEKGDVREAENFLSQAISLEPSDFRVETAFAYMQFRKACEEPTRTDAAELAEGALLRLESAIKFRGNVDPYPYHVLGSQGLSWARHGGLSTSDRKLLLERLIRDVQDGVTKHPASMEIQRLHTDLKREYLLTTVNPQ